MDWNIKKLSDVCTQIFAGGDVPKDRLSKYQTEDYQVPIFSNGEKNKGLYGYTDIARVNEASITVSARGTIGYSEIRNDPFLPVVRLIVLTPNTKIVTLEFLKYAIKGLEFVNSGSSIPQLTVPMIKDYEFSLPSIPKQKRIVNILDQAFSDIEKARANAEQNLKNARELFDSYLQQVFSQRGEGWVDSTLGEICSFQGGSQPPKSVFSSEQSEDNIRLIQIRDYKSDKHIVYIPKDKAKRSCSAEDVMIGRYGPPLFQILRGIEGAYNVALMKAVPNESVVSKEFLFYFLKNRDILRYIMNASSRAAGQIGLNKATLEPYQMSYPPLNRQSDIVSTIQQLKQKTDRLEEVYNEKLKAIDELNKSILQKAFSGQLTKNKGIAA